MCDHKLKLSLCPNNFSSSIQDEKEESESDLFLKQFNIHTTASVNNLNARVRSLIIMIFGYNWLTNPYNCVCKQFGHKLFHNL